MSRRWRMIHGRMHSRAAEQAEAHGEMPLTRATSEVYHSLECKKHRVTRKMVRDFLEKHCCCGWHHVAGPGDVRNVDYYTTCLDEEQKRQLLSLGHVEKRT